MPRYEGVLLDVDGTLVDSNDAHAEAWIRALRGQGIEVSYEEVRSRIGKGGDKMFREVAGIDDDADPRAKAVDQDRARLFLEEFVPGLKGIEGARGLVERMKADGLKVVAASSAKRDELEKLLKIAGVEGMIEEATSSDDAEESKPDPHIVTAALEKAGLAPDRAVMIGDTPYDVEAAGRAGVAVIAVRSGGWDDEGLKGAIAVYDDVADLLANYDESPLGRRAYEG
ncbi:HAD family hydrolase [Paludisphaera sp.]|uniref:HAD family hydrolase n=1 Tax=Paludisphaera sp. TaxID=2017432 RepID=UPI00301D76E2